jgi:hypothetical protein
MSITVSSAYMIQVTDYVKRDVAAGGKLRVHRAKALICIHSSALKGVL